MRTQYERSECVSGVRGVRRKPLCSEELSRAVARGQSHALRSGFALRSRADSRARVEPPLQSVHVARGSFRALRVDVHSGRRQRFPVSAPGRVRFGRAVRALLQPCRRLRDGHLRRRVRPCASRAAHRFRSLLRRGRPLRSQGGPSTRSDLVLGSRNLCQFRCLRPERSGSRPVVSVSVLHVGNVLRHLRARLRDRSDCARADPPAGLVYGRRQVRTVRESTDHRTHGRLHGSEGRDERDLRAMTAPV